MPLPRETAWFYAKSYGWGWGLPARWQGWVSLLTYVAAITMSAAWGLPEDPILFGTITGVLSLIFIGICYWKGEPRSGAGAGSPCDKMGSPSDPHFIQ
jgi:hypothetical protein